MCTNSLEFAVVVVEAGFDQYCGASTGCGLRYNGPMKSEVCSRNARTGAAAADAFLLLQCGKSKQAFGRNNFSSGDDVLCLFYFECNAKEAMIFENKREMRSLIFLLRFIFLFRNYNQ